jgi:hypothetical protein
VNSIMERRIGSCRRELLDRTLIWNQRHLMTALRVRGLLQHPPAAPHPEPSRATTSCVCPTPSPTWITSGSSGATALEA